MPKRKLERKPIKVAVITDEAIKKAKADSLSDPLRFLDLLPQDWKKDQRIDGLMQAFPEIDKETADTLAKSWHTTKVKVEPEQDSK